MNLGPEALARSSAARPWTTIAAWTVALIAAVVISSQLLAGALTTSVNFTDNPESTQAAGLIEQVRGASNNVEFMVVTNDTVRADDPAFASHVAEIQEQVIALGPEVVLGVGSYLTNDGPVSESGHTVLLPVTIAGDGPDTIADNALLVKEVVVSSSLPTGYRTLLAGPNTLANEFNAVAEEDLKRGEAIGIAVALIVLVLVFGTIVSGTIPIVLGMVSITIAMGLAALVGQFFELSFFVTNMITMIGLAVGIDYSLFIVSRYREERARGLGQHDAVVRTGATASRAVMFSGLTVVLALFGMLLLPNTIFRSLGTGAILVVIVAVLASLTLLPAVLALMGDRINWLRVRRKGTLESESAFWDRVTRVVMARPVMAVAASTVTLLLFASAFLSINTGFAGVSTLPDDMDSKQAFLVLEAEFSGGLATPVEVVVVGDSVAATVSSIEDAVAGDSRFGPSQLDLRSTDELAILSVYLPGDVNSIESLETVRYLRDEIVPVAAVSGTVVLVGGDTANSIDFVDQTAKYTPIVFSVVLGLSFILLLVAFRSVVIPAKAILMNLLSVAAAYGLVVAFFQVGVGPEWVKSISSAFGFSQVEVIEDWIPLFLFSVLFGLSMDYHVFLLSRIKERFDITGDNAESVAHGLRTT